MITNIQNTAKRIFFADVFSIFIRFILNYISYVFLIPTVCLSFFVSGWALISIIYQLNEYFVRLVEILFRFINVTNLNFQYSGGEKEIIEIYLIISLIFTAVVEIGKFLLRQHCNKEIKYSFKRKMKFNIISIHAVYTAALIMIIFAKFFKETSVPWFFVLVLFYIVNMATLGCYLFVDYLKQLFKDYLRQNMV